MPPSGQLKKGSGRKNCCRVHTLLLKAGSQVTHRYAEPRPRVSLRRAAGGGRRRNPLRKPPCPARPERPVALETPRGGCLRTAPSAGVAAPGPLEAASPSPRRSRKCGGREADGSVPGAMERETGSGWRLPEKGKLPERRGAGQPSRLASSEG